MIGGNTTAILQVKTVTGENSLGEAIKEWQDVPIIMPGRNEPGLFGFLDFSGGDSKYSTYNAKIQETTHIFISDYVPLDASVKAENSRLLVNGGRYDIMLIDDPMGLHKQLEIYLKYTGGQ